MFHLQLEENVHSVVFRPSDLQMSIMSSRLTVMSSILLLISCALILTIIEKGVLKSPDTIIKYIYEFVLFSFQFY